MRNRSRLGLDLYLHLNGLWAQCQVNDVEKWERKKMRQDAAWTSQRWDGCIGEAKVTGFPEASQLSRTYRTSGQIHWLFIVLMSSNGARKKSCTLLFGFELRQA